MKRTEHARRSSRYALHWKAAVVFDHSLGKPIVQTRTEDLSPGGARILSPYGDLTGTVVNVLLASPARAGKGEVSTVLKARAQVVSTVRTPGMSGYRHGLRFISSPGDGLGLLAELLRQGAAAAGGPSPAATQAPPAIFDAATAKPGEIDPTINAALEKAYGYLRDLAERLNVEHPEYPRGYTIPGVPEFSGLVWEEGRVECETRALSPALAAYDRVSLGFRLSGKKQIHIEREFPASEKLKEWLEDGSIRFESQGVWSRRGSLLATKFEFPCEIDASLLLQSQRDAGKLLMRAQNVAGFGLTEQLLAPKALADKGLDELAGFILGETWRLGALLDV